MYDINNVFSKILQGTIPCNKVFDNEFCFAFHDINPKAPIHIVVIPKGKYVNASDFHKNATSNEISNFYRSIEKICNELELEKNGYRLVANTGDYGGQCVPHFHVHILSGATLGEFA